MISGEYKLIIEANNIKDSTHNSDDLFKNQSVINTKPNSNDESLYALPKPGRPKTLEGKYHIFTARIREDLFSYAQSRTGKDSDYQSVNDYLNQLIARDMLSKK